MAAATMSSDAAAVAAASAAVAAASASAATAAAAAVVAPQTKRATVLIVHPRTQQNDFRMGTALEEHLQRTRRLLAETSALLGPLQSVRSDASQTALKRAHEEDDAMARVGSDPSKWRRVNKAPGTKRAGHLPRIATARMKAWLLRNWDHPYPTEEQKVDLAQQLNLSYDQISNWFVNARRRFFLPNARERAHKRLCNDVLRVQEDVRQSGGIVDPALSLHSLTAVPAPIAAPATAAVATSAVAQSPVVSGRSYPNYVHPPPTPSPQQLMQQAAQQQQQAQHLQTLQQQSQQSQQAPQQQHQQQQQQNHHHQQQLLQQQQQQQPQQQGPAPQYGLQMSTMPTSSQQQVQQLQVQQLQAHQLAPLPRQPHMMSPPPPPPSSSQQASSRLPLGPPQTNGQS